MTGRNSHSTFRHRRSGDALARIVDTVRETAPFTRPEVVRLDANAEGVRMRVGPNVYLLLTPVDGQWMCRDVYVNTETGEPESSPLAQRLMLESQRPLPVSDPRNLSEVAHRFLRRAVAGWEVTAGHASAKEHERRFAAEALSYLSSQARPSLKPWRHEG
jgi:hypothetical protein